MQPLEVLPPIEVAKLRFWHLPLEDHQVRPVVRTRDNRMLFVTPAGTHHGELTQYVQDQVLGGRRQRVAGIRSVRDAVRRWDAPIPDSNSYVIVNRV
jgi:hypothetical protein